MDIIQKEKLTFERQNKTKWVACAELTNGYQRLYLVVDFGNRVSLKIFGIDNEKKSVNFKSLDDAMDAADKNHIKYMKEKYGI